MLTPISTAEVSVLPWVAVAGSAGIAAAGSSERQREFEDILSNALRRFQRIAMRSLRNPHDAEDAVQDAMLSACRHIARFDGLAQMSTWLTTIVINAARMQLRRDRRRPNLSLDESHADGEVTESELVVYPSPNPEQVLSWRELRDLVTKLISTLPSPQRNALRLHQRDDFSIKNAAATFGVPVGTIKAQLSRGRAALSERFQHATRKTKAETSGCAPAVTTSNKFLQ